MTLLLIQLFGLLLLAATASAVVLTREPINQTIGLSFYGLLLAVVFLAFQAPDVALSQIVVGAIALPMLVMLGLAEVRRHKRERARSGESDRSR